MKKIHMVDLGGQYNKIKTEVEIAFSQVISETAFINGPAVNSFTTNLGVYLDTDYIVPCANGTDALQIALMALELPKGSEIIVPTFNYVASAEVIALLGYKPVFIDADPEYFNLNIELLEDALSDKTKAVISVHLFGQSTDMKELLDFCKTNNLWLIEDNAQAIGGNYKLDGEEVNNGLMGHIGTTSFFPSKNLGCFGDGGAVYTTDEEIYNNMKRIANHGQKSKYNYEQIGINSRLDTIQAALLDIKLKFLDNYISKRREAADFYDRFFDSVFGVEIPKRHKNSFHVFHQYTLRVSENKRDFIKNGLAEAQIPSMIYYPHPLHMNKAYSQFGYSIGDFPEAEKLSREVLSLPMHTELDTEQQSYICETFKKLAK